MTFVDFVVHGNDNNDADLLIPTAYHQGNGIETVYLLLCMVFLKLPVEFGLCWHVAYGYYRRTIGILD